MKYKILFIGNKNIHLKNWLEFFYKNNCEVYYLGFYCNFSEYDSCLTRYLFVEPTLSKLYKLKIYIKYINSVKPDLILFHYLDYKLILSLFSKKIPIIACCYGYDIFIAPYKSIIFRLFLKFVLNRLRKVFSIAGHMTKELVDFIGVDSKKIFTISWGCNRRIFYRNFQIKRNDSIIRIINPRGFETHYNWKTLVKAIPIVLEKNKNCEFVFANIGSQEEDAKQMIKSMNLENKVKFLGKLSLTEIAKEYNKSHIYVSLSLIDGNNISLNEAMACGCFPICSDIPASRQWIKNKKNGILLKNNFDYKELANHILNFKNNMDLVEQSLRVNYKIVEERADFHKNMKIIQEVIYKMIR